LENLFFNCLLMLKNRRGAIPPPRQDLVLHAQSFDKYAHIAPRELAHEAGYDAFMTGTVFACLVAHASDIAETSSSEEEDGQLCLV
jgi:hypothetical protein